jgi:hypothetical protein
MDAWVPPEPGDVVVVVEPPPPMSSRVQTPPSPNVPILVPTMDDGGQVGFGEQERRSCSEQREIILIHERKVVPE